MFLEFEDTEFLRNVKTGSAIGWEGGGTALCVAGALGSEGAGALLNGDGVGGGRHDPPARPAAVQHRLRPALTLTLHQRVPARTSRRTAAAYRAP